MLTVITDHWYTLTLPKQKGSQTLYQGARILNNRGLGLVPMARCLSLKYTKLILRPADSRPTLLTRRLYGHFLSSPLYLYHPYNSHCRSFLDFLCVRLLFFSNLQFLCNHQTSMQLCRFRERLSTTKAQRSFYFSTGCLPAAEVVCVSRTSVGCCRTPPFHSTTMTSPGSSPTNSCWSLECQLSPQTAQLEPDGWQSGLLSQTRTQDQAVLQLGKNTQNSLQYFSCSHLW